MSTLVHEMCHLEQAVFGKPSRNGYHNKEWGEMMKAVGLIPSNTGQTGGKQTGQQMTHYIEDGGRFDVAYSALNGKDFAIPYAARSEMFEAKAKKKRASKTKYTCPGCNMNAWAKPDVNIKCGECGETLIAEDQD